MNIVLGYVILAVAVVVVPVLLVRTDVEKWLAKVIFDLCRKIVGNSLSQKDRSLFFALSAPPELFVQWDDLQQIRSLCFISCSWILDLVVAFMVELVTPGMRVDVLKCAVLAVLVIMLSLLISKVWMLFVKPLLVLRDFIAS